jgi:hypothetical protein
MRQPPLQIGHCLTCHLVIRSLASQLAPGQIAGQHVDPASDRLPASPSSGSKARCLTFILAGRLASREDA